jgi:hypothetical protein
MEKEFITEQANIACDFAGILDNRSKTVKRIEKILSECKTECEVERVLRPLKFGEISLAKFFQKWEDA